MTSPDPTWSNVSSFYRGLRSTSAVEAKDCKFDGWGNVSIRVKIIPPQREESLDKPLLHLYGDCSPITGLFSTGCSCGQCQDMDPELGGLLRDIQLVPQNPAGESLLIIPLTSLFATHHQIAGRVRGWLLQWRLWLLQWQWSPTTCAGQPLRSGRLR